MRTRLLKGLRLLGSLSQASCETLQPSASRAVPAFHNAFCQQQHRPWSASHLWLGKYSSRSFAAAAGKGSAAHRAGAAAAADKQQPSSFSRWWKAFQGVPTVPKVLGLAGAIPFIALAPPVSKHLTAVLPADVVDNSAMFQCGYGVTIVSFLGAVHWGVAMSSSLAGPLAARIANEAFIYSVLPALLAWPVTVMEPGSGAVVLSLLLPACYLADYSRRNLGLPQWYMALRLPLTVLATFGMLLTATRHVHQEFDRAREINKKETVKQE